MVAVRRAGGPYTGRGNLRFSWYGRALAARIQGVSERAAERVGQNATAKAKADAVVDTGEFRDGIGYEVRKIGSGVVVVLYAASPHSIYVILGTSKMPARDPIRPAMDVEMPRYAGYVRDELGRAA